jgi:CheY-like chemotaxis protein/HPt (histidine-containing phosphotransfer) domain-containing protein
LTLADINNRLKPAAFRLSKMRNKSHMTAAETKDQNRAGIHILLVDDYDINHLVAQQYLEHAGYEVDIAQNGRQAVDAFKRKRYHLILMDLEMPIMDGYEATKRIRKWESGIRNAEAEVRGQKTGDREQNPEFRNQASNLQPLTSNIPIIAMSGHITQGLSDRCLTTGMNDSIGKPLQRESLVSMVQKWTTRGSEVKKNRIKSKTPSRPDQTSSDEQLPIDLDRAIQEFMGEKEILLNVLDKFICRANAQIDSTRVHIAHKEYRLVASEAHAIKGGAANLLAVKLSNIAAELESAAEQNFSAKTATLVDELEEELSHLAKYLQQTGVSKA